MHQVIRCDGMTAPAKRAEISWMLLFCSRNHFLRPPHLGKNDFSVATKADLNITGS
jgi:hypothetical protein